jgi:hypothetical protein
MSAPNCQGTFNQDNLWEEVERDVFVQYFIVLGNELLLLLFLFV